MAGKIKILFVQPNAKLGGSFQSLYLLLQRLNDARYEKTVLLPNENNLLTEQLKSVRSDVFIHKFPSIPITMNFKYRLLIFDLLRFHLLKNYYLRRMPKFDADIIHINSLHSVFGLLLAKKMETPAVWHIRERIPRFCGHYLRRSLLKQFNDTIVKKLICISENEAKHLPKNKIEVIHNFYHLDRQPMGENKPVKFLSLGSFTYDKGFWLFINAVKYLSKWYTPLDFKVVLMGISNNLTITKRLLREKTIDQFKSEIKKQQIVDFFEFYPQRHKIHPDFFAPFHVLVRLSLHENPWGRDIIEAMSTGRALIATGSYAKFVRPDKNGYLISTPDPVKLADKMKVFIEDLNLVNRFGEKSFELASNMFNPAVNTKKIEQIYESLLNNSK